jgi:hypothetical protein
MVLFDGLPEAELVVAGLRDLEAGIESVPALLVSNWRASIEAVRRRDSAR